MDSFESCSKRNDISENLNEIELYSGEDIFRAIFFLEGELVNKIASLEHAKTKRDAIMDSPTMISMKNTMQSAKGVNLESEISVLRNDIVQSVTSINPSVFENLKNSLISGDVYKFNESVKKSTGILNTTLIQNERVENEMKLVDYAYEKGGINPNDFDLNTIDGIKEYNETMISFVDSKGINSKTTPRIQSGFIIVFLVVAFALVVVAAYLLALIGGGVFFFIGGYI